MLQEMRKYTKSWVSSLFLGGLALTFVLWGIADIFRGSADTTVFSVGDSKVTIDAFARDYHNALRNAGTVLPPDQAKAMAQQVLDRMMLGTALDNLTNRLGLTASDAQVRRQIQNIQAFSGPLGGFDHDKFMQVIGQAGYGEDEFVDVTRRDVARGEMLRAVEGGYGMPVDYARAIFSYVNEVRAAEYVMLTPGAAGTIAPPSDAVLAAYVKAHPESFSTPEYRDVSIAAIGVDDLAPSIAVTDKQIDDEIANNRADYIVDEKRELEQIGFKTEADAKAGKAELDSGKAFEAVAFERKLSPADYKLGELTQADLAIDPARAKVAFALPLNTASDPIKGNFGWVIIRATKITPGSAKSHDEVKLTLQRKLALARMTDMANAYTDAIGGGASIDEAARKSGMKFTHVAALDAQGLAADGSKVAAASSAELVAAIFKAEIGEDGDPFQTQDGHYFAIKVGGVTPPRPKSLDAVRAVATASWIADQRQAQLLAKARALTAKANHDHSLGGVAVSLGAPVQSSPALTRGTEIPTFNKPVVAAIFAAPPGGAIFQATGDGGYIIARVSGVQHPPPPEGDISYLRGVSQLSGEIASDITISLAKAQQQEDRTTVNQKLVDSTVGNSGSGS
ncbi:MAG TPA: SurA N-terminal domain-containing protein [Rhizomicrobium sp.]|jgi:peptidyl-prolyl cis-trans isomerase D|nr:SurA N-terminal domain-containing protein [Rhizomicrobium sp.]